VRGCKFQVAKRQVSLFPVDEGPTLFEREGTQSFNFSSEGYAQAIRAGEKMSREDGGEVNVKIVCAKGAAPLAFCKGGRCEVDASGQRSTEKLAGSKPRKPKPRADLLSGGIPSP
jgi:hypothetical protein